MTNRFSKVVAAIVFGVMLTGLPVMAADAPAPAAPLAGGRADLPQTHEYQKALRQYMATLTEKEFDHGITTDIGPKPGSVTDPDEQYRNYIYTLTPQPLVGSKRGEPAVNTPPVNFTLEKIETPKGIFRPHGWAEATMSLVQWNYPGNLYYNNRGLKMRCFVGSAVNLMMIDDLLDKTPLLLRTDRVSYWLVRTCAAYPVFKELLPPEVQKAYQNGVRKLAERVLAIQPKGEEANLDLMTPVGLSYAARVVNDADFTKRVEVYARKMLTDPQYLHPAGYWVERGGLDINFSGTCNYFAIWAALMNDWPFANETVAKVYRLRAHLMLPEPNGMFTGPSAFNTRTGGSAMIDQWDYANRDRGALMITDEVAYLTPVPKAEDLAVGGDSRALEYNRQIHENLRAVAGQNIFQANADIVNTPWVFSILPNYNFPASVNPAFEFYKKGALAHLKSLAEKNSPMMKSPYLRGENFVRDFDKAFVTARQPSFAAIVHSGPVAVQKPNDGLFQFGAPLGFGGGQLSAFWTPETGSVILTRRAGQHWELPFDLAPAWRTWPLHAVSGITSGGKVFTSARIVKPEVTSTVKEKTASIKAEGPLVAITYIKDPDAADKEKAREIYYDGTLDGKLTYSRLFTIDEKGVSVETTLTGDGKDNLAELVETIPLFVSDSKTLGAQDPKTTIEFGTAGAWSAATEVYTSGVTGVKITRFTGSVIIKFDKPQRVKLAPEWKDKFLTGATCRNVTVDLLDKNDAAAPFNTTKKVAYRIEAAE